MLDCIVVGGGPAGLSAAINLHQRGKSCLVLSAGAGYLAKAERMDNYLGMPGMTGQEMLCQFGEHAAGMDIEVRTGRVGNILPFDGRFMVNFGGDMLESRSIILATGVSKAKPVAGEAERLGMGVSYCATCDGMLYRGRDVVVWGLAEEAASEANFLAGIGCRVTFVAARRPAELEEAIPFEAGAIREVLGEGVVSAVRLADGRELPCTGVFILRAAVAPDTLLPGLELEDGFVRTGRDMSTSVPGVFAAGDLVGKPLQVAKAVGEGLVAALSAAEYLDRADREGK